MSMDSSKKGGVQESYFKLAISMDQHKELMEEIAADSLEPTILNGGHLYTPIHSIASVLFYRCDGHTYAKVCEANESFVSKTLKTYNQAEFPKWEKDLIFKTGPIHNH